MRPFRIALAAGGVLVLVVAGGLLFAQSRLDQSALRRSVIASVERQSGRSLRLDRLEVRLLPWPSVAADGVALADTDPGGAPMLSIGHLQATIAVWPLLRHVVALQTLTLDHLVLHARRSADGHGNWEMKPKQVETSGGGSSSGQRRPWGVSFGTVHIAGADLSWQDFARRQHVGLHLAQLNGAGLQGEQPHFALTGTAHDASYTLQGETGPLSRLFQAGDHATPWRLAWQGSEQIAGASVATAAIDGSVSDPLERRGYDLAVTATIAQLSDLDRLFAHAGLPSVQGLDASAHLIDRDGRPVLAVLHAKAGPSVLPIGRQMTLRHWTLDAASPDSPIAVAAGGAWNGRTLALEGRIASLRTLQSLLADRNLATTGKPMPVSMTLGIGASAWQIDGSVGIQSTDLQIKAHVPAMRALLGADAPDPGPVTLSMRFQVESEAKIGTQAGSGPVYSLSGLQVTSDAGDLSGSVGMSLQGRPKVTADLVSTRLDLDRILAKPAEAVSQVARPAPDSASSAASAPAGDQPLPWPLLRAADAELSLRVASLISGGAQFQDAVGHVSLKGGLLLLDPAQARGPGGPISLRIQANANAAPPTIDISMQPAMLPASLLARLAGAPDQLQGNVELVGQIAAKGDTRSALLASAEGHAGASIVDGTIQNAALAGTLGRSGALAAVVREDGVTSVRCLGLHATLADARMQLDRIGLRTDRVSLDGHGQVGLASRDLDLDFLAQVAIGAASATVPVRVTGSLSHPQPALGAAAPGNRFSLTIGAASGAAADCSGLLQTAREGLPGPMPRAVQTRHKAPKPADLLRSLGLLH